MTEIVVESRRIGRGIVVAIVAAVHVRVYGGRKRLGMMSLVKVRLRLLRLGRVLGLEMKKRWASMSIGGGFDF